MLILPALFVLVLCAPSIVAAQSSPARTPATAASVSEKETGVVRPKPARTRRAAKPAKAGRDTTTLSGDTRPILSDTFSSIAKLLPALSINIDTFGLPSSLTILEGEKPKEDIEIKETARFLTIAAYKAFFSGRFQEAMDRIQEGFQRKYYVLHQKRLLSRLLFVEGHADSSAEVAHEIAGDTDALVDDKSRVEFLETVRRYLKVSTESRPLAYSQAEVLDGDVKGKHRFITPVGIDADAFGRILQTSFGTNEVIVFTKGLEYQMKLTGISQPYDVAVDGDGNIYVTSFGSDRVFRFDKNGDGIGTFGGKGSGPGQFFGPQGIVVSPDRYIFVVDAGNHRIQKFTRDGTFILSFGSRGSNPGQFLLPRSLAIEPRPGTDAYNVVVLCYEGALLSRFDPYGNFISTIPTAGLSGPRDFDRFGDQGFIFCTADSELVVLDNGVDTVRAVVDEQERPLKIDGVSGIRYVADDGLIYTSAQIKSQLYVHRSGDVAQKTLMNISNLDFEHYPYVGVTVQVTTGSGEAITGLSRRNFTVIEDNFMISPVSVQPLTQAGPLQLIIHIDPSTMIDRREILLRNFLSDLTRHLPGLYHLSIRKGRKEILPATDNPYFIRKSLDRLGEPTPPSFVKDLHESLNSFAPVRGRRNLLILTQRDEDIPREEFSELSLLLLNRGISLFVLHFSDQQLPVLRMLSQRSGGGYWRLKEYSAPNLAYELASSKNASYFLVYPIRYKRLPPNMAQDMILRLIYLSDMVTDRIRYFAPSDG